MHMCLISVPRFESLLCLLASISCHFSHWEGSGSNDSGDSHIPATPGMSDQLVFVTLLALLIGSISQINQLGKKVLTQFLCLSLILSTQIIKSLSSSMNGLYQLPSEMEEGLQLFLLLGRIHTLPLHPPRGPSNFLYISFISKCSNISEWYLSTISILSLPPE